MDPRHLFTDQRFSGFCVYCGGTPETHDHCPSKVLLDEPFPPNLPIVESCRECNQRWSLDEEYLACFLECVVTGSAEPSLITRPNVARILTSKPALCVMIRSCLEVNEGGQFVWHPDWDRVLRVVLKLARGHISYELSLPKLERPISTEARPFVTLNQNERGDYEQPNANGASLWPEIGSRAFVGAIKGRANQVGDWIVTQPGRYRYLVSQSAGDFVQIVLSEYLACRVVWD